CHCSSNKLDTLRQNLHASLVSGTNLISLKYYSKNIEFSECLLSAIFEQSSEFTRSYVARSLNEKIKNNNTEREEIVVEITRIASQLTHFKDSDSLNN